MKHRSKRFLSILLGLTLVLGLLPGMSLTAFADDPSYNLWVGGVEVKMSQTSGDGWSYDADSKILTLTGYSNNGAVYKWGDPPTGAPEGSFMYSAGIYTKQDLTICISGTNNITGAPDSDKALSENFGIRATGNLTITGNGTLNVHSGNQGDGISSQEDITINGGTVKAEGDGCGISAIGDVVIKGGTVEATGKLTHGIQSSVGSVTIEDGAVTASDSADSMGGTCGIIAYTDVIINGGNITATSVTNMGISGDNVKINSGSITATGYGTGISSFSGSVTINGGTVEATGNTRYGIWGGQNATAINGGTITVSGADKSINGNVINAIAGVGWTNTAGTEGKAAITTSTTGQELSSYKKAQFPAYTVTYKVVDGTWSDDTTAEKTEPVASGSKPDTVPTGMKASEGYTDGAWNTDPKAATITEATTFTYTFTALPTYEVTYKVANGTWSDGSTADKTETVQSGSKPASVPTGMKASEGYTDGAWNTNPADATITEATTFTYTFTAKPAATVTKAPKAKELTYTGAAQALVTAGEADGGTMQYALGTATEATEQYTTSIPAKTDAGTYYVWYKVEGDKNHNDTKPAAVKTTIAPKSITGATVTLDKTQLTYNGLEQSVSVTGVKIDKITLTADDYTVSGNTGTDKGDYTVTVTGKGNYCDTATAAWKIVEKAMTVKAESIKVPYDGQTHGITVNVIDPASGAVVKYGTTEGTYNFDASPTITEAGTLTVYFKVTAEGYTDYTGSATVTITKDEPSPEPEPTPEPSGRLLPLLEPTKENNALKLSWTQMKNVEGYDVFLTKCFTNFSSTPYATVSADKSKFEFKGLKKQTMYKAYVRAYVTENGVKKYVSERIDVHCITGGGTDEYTIPVKVRGKDLVIAAGKTKKIEATVIGKNEKKKVLNHNDGKLRYISLDPSVATVSEDGTVKALKEGSAKILVMACNGVRTTVKVTVGKKAEKLSFVKKKYTVREGKTINLYKLLNIDPKKAIVDLKWESSSKKTATVDANGVVTGVKKGTVTITVKDAVSGLKATVKIQVKKAKKK